MGTRNGQTGSSPLSEISWLRGLGMGVVPFLLAFVGCSILLGIEIGNTEGGFTFLEFYGDQAWKLLVALFTAAFWGAHPGAIDNSGQFFQQMDSVPEFAYTAVVLGLLLGYGYRSVTGADRSYTDSGAVLQGAAITLGYGVLMALSFFGLQAILDGANSGLTDQSLKLIMTAGVGYPVLLGGAGGYLGNVRRSSSQPVNRPAGQQSQPTVDRQQQQWNRDPQRTAGQQAPQQAAQNREQGPGGGPQGQQPTDSSQSPAYQGRQQAGQTQIDQRQSPGTDRQDSPRVDRQHSRDASRQVRPEGRGDGSDDGTNRDAGTSGSAAGVSTCEECGTVADASLGTCPNCGTSF